MFGWLKRKLRGVAHALFPTTLRRAIQANHREEMAKLEEIKGLRLQDLDSLRKFEPLQGIDDEELKDLVFSFEKMRSRSKRRQRNNTDSKVRQKRHHSNRERN